MSLLCIGCASKGGRRLNCRSCVEVAPLPLALKVQEIIRSVAVEHRTRMDADFAMFKADMKKASGAHERLLARKNRQRRNRPEAANGPV